MVCILIEIIVEDYLYQNIIIKAENIHNIIINDLDEMALQLSEYRFLTPMYIWRRKGSNTYENGTLDGSVKVFYRGGPEDGIPLADKSLKFEDLSDLVENDNSNTDKLFGFDKKDTGGDSETDLIYPQDLIANAGDSVVTILDKIKNFLGDFEYFYDIDGQFIF